MKVACISIYKVYDRISNNFNKQQKIELISAGGGIFFLDIFKYYDSARARTLSGESLEGLKTPKINVLVAAFDMPKKYAEFPPGFGWNKTASEFAAKRTKRGPRERYSHTM